MTDDFQRVMDVIESEIRLAHERHVREPLRIRVTPHALKGSIVSLPIVDRATADYYKRKGIKNPYEILVHPADWEVIKDAAKQLAASGKMTESPNYGPDLLVGLPVVDDADA